MAIKVTHHDAGVVGVGHRVIISCGCGFVVTAQGEKDDGHYDVRDAAEAALDRHFDADEQYGVCRPWIGDRPQARGR